MSTPRDPFDELADIFMTSTSTSDGDAPDSAHDERRDGDGSATVAAPVELLIVGHLPVRAALWLTPYADAVARDLGPTALVRLDGDEAMIQMLGGDDVLVDPDACSTLESAITHLGPHVARWVVRPSARTPMSDLLRSGAGRITILGSADQVAVLNTYQLVKDIVDSARRNGIPLPELGLAVIGTDAAGAREVVDRVNRTASEQLGIQIPLSRCLRRMDATIRATALRSFPGQGRPALDDVLSWLASAATAAPMLGEQPPVERAGTATMEPSLPREDAPRADHGRRDDAPAVAPGAPIHAIPRPPRPEAPVAPTPRVVDHHDPRPAETPAPRDPLADAPTIETFRDAQRIAGETRRTVIRLEPKATADLEGKAPAHPIEPAATDGGPQPLASHVAGVRALRPRCPGHERIELAVDDAGRLHLLLRDGALRELPIVSAWARAHRELIEMASPGERLSPTATPITHVFTATPTDVADLHGTDLHLHLLARVTVEGREGWFSTALNAPAHA